MRGGTIGGHLAACSVLRSSAYRKYASSLRTCARDDLTPAPASAHGPARGEVRGIAALAADSDFYSLRPYQRVRAESLELGAAELSILNRGERSDAAHLAPGGAGGDRGRRAQIGSRTAPQGGSVLPVR